MYDYVVCVRNTKTKGADKVFGNEPGPTKFLRVPKSQYPDPTPSTGQIIPRKQWVDEVAKEAEIGTNQISGKPIGDILVFIHGYNNNQEIVLKRHRKLKEGLEKEGYRGTVVSYDWPSANYALNYLEDRDDAKATARRLRDDCINLFSTYQDAGCEINLHLLGHSTGAYVIRHAFAEADEKTSIKTRHWSVSQIALIGGDISSRSLKKSDSKSDSLYRHCVRLTNYQNPYDSALKLSNVKRIGLAPRVGRVGLPEGAHSKAVNVNCNDLFKKYEEERPEENVDYYGNFSHSWHIGNKTFTQDLRYTIDGNIDRNHIPTRRLVSGELTLAKES